MVLGWNKETFSDIQSKLSESIKTCESDEEKYYYQKMLDNFNCVCVDLFSNNNPQKRESLKNRLKDKSYEAISYNRFYYYIEKLKEMTGYLMDSIYSIQEEYDEELSFEPIYLANSKVISMVAYFFNNFDSSLVNTSTEILNSDSTFVTFTHSTGKNIELSDSCYTSDRDNKYIFLRITQRNNYSDYLDFVHEMGHSINYYLNPDGFYLAEPNQFSEVEAIFPELVAAYDCINEDNRNEIYSALFKDLISTLDRINYLFDTGVILKLWQNNNCKINFNFLSKLNNLGFTKKFTNNTLSTDILDDGKYVFSYLVSLELLNIYRYDKEEALKKYREIISCKDIDNFLSILRIAPIGNCCLQEMELIINNYKQALEKSFGDGHGKKTKI